MCLFHFLHAIYLWQAVNWSYFSWYCGSGWRHSWLWTSELRVWQLWLSPHECTQMALKERAHTEITLPMLVLQRFCVRLKQSHSCQKSISAQVLGQLIQSNVVWYAQQLPLYVTSLMAGLWAMYMVNCHVIGFIRRVYPVVVVIVV